jgi:hypothetical protein
MMFRDESQSASTTANRSNEQGGAVECKVERLQTPKGKTKALLSLAHHTADQLGSKLDMLSPARMKGNLPPFSA